MVTKVSRTQVRGEQSSCTGSSAREQGHLGVRGRGTHGLMQQSTGAKQVHARNLPSKTALVTVRKPWQRSARNLWGQMGTKSPRSLSSVLGFAPEQFFDGAGCSCCPHWWGRAVSFSSVCSAMLWLRWTQFLLINVTASAMPPIPFPVFDTFRCQTYPPWKRATESYLQRNKKNSSYSQKQTVCCQETGIRDLGIPFKPCISKLRYHLFWDDTHWIPLLQSRYRKTEDENSWMILITCSHGCLDTNLWHSLCSSPVNHWQVTGIIFSLLLISSN